MVQALGHLAQEIPEQCRVEGPPVLVRTEDARKEEVPGRLIDALDEMVEARGRGARPRAGPRMRRTSPPTGSAPPPRCPPAGRSRGCSPGRASPTAGSMEGAGASRSRA